MDDLAQRIARVREELGPSWDERRAMVLYAGVGQRRRRRAVRRAAIGAVGVAAVAVAVVARYAGETSQDTLAAREAKPAEASPASPVPTPVVVATAPKVDSVRLADGSVAEFSAADSELRVVTDRADDVALDLVSGHAHFDVVPNQARRFVVRAGEITVSVVGTLFDVEHVEGGVRVAVERGKVRVEGPGASMFLAVGESRTFSPASLTRVGPREGERATAKHDSRKAGSWRSLGQSGDYEGAYRLLHDGARIDDEPAALMDAADAARLSGHPRDAIDYLGRLVRDHAQSPLAPLAAFTLGRVYLDQLGEPARAAQSFADARRLSPESSLAQDALAREIEALSKGGDARGAYLRAREYVDRYPDGRRLRAVRLYGHLE